LLSFYRDVDSNNLIVMSSMVPIGLYFAWGLKTFFGYRTGGGYIKVLAVYTLISVVGTILLFLGLITYASMG